MGAGLGAHLDDVVAEHAAGEINIPGPIRISPLVAAYGRGPPFPVRESGAEIIPRGNESYVDIEALPRHAGVGGRKGQLHAAGRGVVAAAVHDLGDRCQRDGADAGGAARRRLRLRRSCQQQEARRRGCREGRQPGKGGGCKACHDAFHNVVLR